MWCNIWSERCVSVSALAWRPTLSDKCFRVSTSVSSCVWCYSGRQSGKPMLLVDYQTVLLTSTKFVTDDFS